MMAGNIATAQAYIADITTPTNRSRGGMGIMGGADKNSEFRMG